MNQSAPLFDHPPKSICILRLSAIGDVCNALAMVQGIQAHWQDTRITWIIGKTEYPLFAHVPNIDFVVYDKKTGMKGMFALWQTLRHQHFDALLNMQTAFRASVLSMGIRATYKVGFGKVRSREMQHWFVNHRVSDPENPHVLSGFLAFAKDLGIPLIVPKWDLPVPAEIQQKMRTFIDPDCQTLIIAPCSSKAEKEWTATGYAHIANLAHTQNKQVILCGANSPRERAVVEEILQHCQFTPLNLLGKTSLVELASLIKEADLVLSPDSGTAHIANLVGTAVISLHAYHNPKRTAPFLHQDKVISVYEEALAKEMPKHLPWAYKLTTPNLMANISAQAVVEKMQEVGFLA